MEMKQIPGFSAFRITNNGQVFNKHTKRLADYDCHGYRRISLKRDDGKRVGVDVHRLVASTWIGPIPSGYWVNHENGNKADNRVENLRIDTPSYNQQHRYDTLGQTGSGRKPERAAAMCALHQVGWSQARIAKLFGCSAGNVSRILKRQ